jgi:hypothetical protein
VKTNRVELFDDTYNDSLVGALVVVSPCTAVLVQNKEEHHHGNRQVKGGKQQRFGFSLLHDLSS